MKKARMLLTVIAMIVCLCKCGKAEEPEIVYSGKTNSYDIQISDTEYVTLQVPIEAELTLQDGYSHFEFSDGTIIDMSNTQLTPAQLDEETGLYVSDSSVQLNIDDKCILVSCTGSMVEQMKTYLQGVKRVEILTDLYKELRIKKLPKYKSVEMELVDNMYLPANTPKRNWLSLESQLYTDGTDYLQLTIYDFPIGDIVAKLRTQLLCNTGKNVVDEWYQDDDTLYMKAGDHYIVTKRLAYNCTYVYSCTEALLDCALQGADKIYGTSEKLKR